MTPFIFRHLRLGIIVCVITCASAEAQGLISIDINTPLPGTTTEILPFVAYDMTATGNQFGIHMSRDEGRFAYVMLKGDFDVWCRIAIVQNEKMNLATAGLMARKSLAPDAEFVSIVANSKSPKWDASYGVDAYIWGVRLRRGGHVTESMSADKDGYWYCPALNRHLIPFPNCWLRLKRTGNVFTGYFAETAEAPKPNQWRRDSFQSTWTLTGQTPPTFVDKNGIFPETLYVGICLDANAEEWGNTRYKAWAQFREIHGLTPTHAEIIENGPSRFVIHPNYPNPFNLSTTISYEVPYQSYIRLAVYNLSGRMVKLLTDSLHTAGQYRLTWDSDDENGTAVAAGIYLLRFDADSKVYMQKMTLLR